MTERTVVIYHRVDFDGIFSGCIVKKWALDQNGVEPDMIGYNYGDTIQPIEAFYGYDHIVMVDVSFPPAVMKQFRDKSKMGKFKVTWIDHHITAVNSSTEYNYSDLFGLRKIGIAACELTWQYFYGDNIPLIIQYLGAYDVWDKNRFDWENEILPLQSALREEYGVGEFFIWPVFVELIEKSSEILPKLINIGKLLNRYDTIRFKSIVKRFAFPITVAGKYNGIALMGTDFTSLVFQSVLDQYDIYCIFNRKQDDSGNEVYVLSLYAEPGRIPDMNLGVYLREQFGDAAGGHATAAGAQIPREAFDKLLNSKEI